MFFCSSVFSFIGSTCQGYVAIPKSSSKKRIISNTNLFDFELDDQEMAQLDSLDEGTSEPSCRIFVAAD